jgi:hypothetical protein
LPHAGQTVIEEFDGAGAALWHSFADVLDMNAAETEALRQACFTADELARIHLLLSKTNPLIKGSMGQPRINPLLAEARHHRRILFKALGQIAIPANREVVIAPEAANILSLRAQTAARARWDGRKAGA